VRGPSVARSAALAKGQPRASAPLTLPAMMYKTAFRHED